MVTLHATLSTSYDHEPRVLIIGPIGEPAQGSFVDKEQGLDAERLLPTVKTVPTQQSAADEGIHEGHRIQAGEEKVASDVTVTNKEGSR